MKSMRQFNLLLAILAAAGCHTTRTIGQPALDVKEVSVHMQPYDQVDILFVIDDSFSMAPKQKELRARFPGLLANVRERAGNASYHIGVITSDLGAGTNGSVCRPSGDGGHLRTMPAPSMTNVQPACAGITLDGGLPFIDYDARTGTSNVVGGDVETAFSCMATTGEFGCGFEHQLESTYVALTGANPGFVRDDAMLVVVLLTDEDDCSAPPDSDLFDASPTGVMSYGTLHSFRCTQFGVGCNGHALDANGGTQTNCAPLTAAEGGKLYDVNRYVRLFSSDRAHGGLKDDPAGVLLLSIAPPPTPFITMVTMPCGDQANTQSCMVLSHSCVAPNDVTFFGDPAVRIDTVVRSTFNGIQASICDADFSPALDKMAATMAGRMGGGCLPGALVENYDSTCTVTVDGQHVRSCAEGPAPCWGVSDDATCPARETPDGGTQKRRVSVTGVPANAKITAVCTLFVSGA
jgi:hypothetical protein